MGVSRGLCLKAVRFHNRVHIVEGHRCLWTIMEASDVLGVVLHVQVNIQDLYTGAVRGHLAQRPLASEKEESDAHAMAQHSKVEIAVLRAQVAQMQHERHYSGKRMLTTWRLSPLPSFP